MDTFGRSKAKLRCSILSPRRDSVLLSNGRESKRKYFVFENKHIGYLSMARSEFAARVVISMA